MHLHPPLLRRLNNIRVLPETAKDQRVVGCATVASQTAETEGVRRLSPRPLLLLHGTGDQTLSPWCSQQLYEEYGAAKDGEKTLKMFEGDDHALTRNAKEAEGLICEFIIRCAGASVTKSEEEAMHNTLIGGSKKEKVEVMQKGGDLRGQESVD